MALLGLVVAISASGPLRWLGTAMALATVPPLGRTAAQWPWWQARRDRLPLVLLLALMVLLLGPLLAGEPPASRDHGIHYFQIRLLVEELLPSGRLWGWSPSLNHGYPYGESYPVLGYLWMAAAHLLSFGAIPLRTSYAWGLAALWMLSAGVAWWLAASITRELRERGWASVDDPSRDAVEAEGAREAIGDREREATGDREAGPRPVDVAGWAGLVAAVLWLVDPGASRQGGWNYLMFHGVWPQLLAATLWAGSLGLTWRALARPSPRRIALAALVLGASLWAHPFGLLTAVASAFGLSLVVLLLPAARGWPGPWRSLALVHLGAACLGAAWLATFFGSAESMARAPVPWAPLAELSAGVLQGTLFAGHWLWVGPLVVVGAAALIRRGGARGLVVLGLVAILLVLASEEVISRLRLDLLLSGFKNLQFPRYAIPLKPLWFVLAGVGAGRVIAWARARRPSPAAVAWDADAWLRRGVIAGLLAPLLATLAPDAGRLLARPVGAIDTLRSAGLAGAEAELLAALRREAAALAPERPLTVAVMREGMGGGTYPIFSVADAGGHLVLDSHVPTVNFKHRLRRRPRAYASLGVTHVIHDRPVPSDEEALAAALQRVGSYGPYTLERFEPPLGQPRRVAEFSRGGGEVEVIVDEPERLELELREVGPRSVLVLGRAPHGRWELTLDGEPLEVEPRTVDDHGLGVMTVRVPHAGRVVASYLSSERERRAVWLSAITLGLALVALGFGARPIATRAPSPALRRIVWSVAALAGVAVLVVGMRRQASKLEQTWSAMAVDHLGDDEDEPRVTLVSDLVVDDALRLEREPEAVCSGLLGKNVLEGCSEAAHRPGTSFLYRDPYLYRCLRLSLPPHGWATLRMPVLPEPDTVVVGSVIRHVREGSGKRVRWGVGQEGRGPLRSDRHDFVLERDAKGRTDELRFRNDGDAIEQICVSAAVLRRPAG